MRLREQALAHGARLESGEVHSVHRLAGEGFVAHFAGREERARFVVVATGLIDTRPSIQGLSDPMAGRAVRFCPICDGYEALDKRIGVLGPMHAAGKKALFLRTYSPYVSLFVFDDVEPEPTFGALLTDAGVKIARSPLRVDQRDDCIVIFDAGGEAHLLDVF